LVKRSCHHQKWQENLGKRLLKFALLVKDRLQNWLLYGNDVLKIVSQKRKTVLGSILLEFSWNAVYNYGHAPGNSFLKCC
jgi:hypothetical protein